MDHPTTLHVTRERIAPPRLHDVGLKQPDAIHAAEWIWHPELGVDEPAFVHFQLDFECDGDGLEIEVSADQRFELTLDGRHVGSGPDASDPMHWSYARYRIALPSGRHTLDAIVWWLGNKSPHSRMSLRPGFILAGLGAADALVSTGKAAWKVRHLKSRQTVRIDDFEARFLGESSAFDANLSDGPWQAAGLVPVIKTRPHVASHGNSWRFYPADLPEQRADIFGGGTIRAVLPFAHRDSEPWPASSAAEGIRKSWQALLDTGASCVVEAGKEASVLWDLQEYLCGWVQLEVAAGSGSAIHVHWAESFHEALTGDVKGNRDLVEGKFFRGFGDHFMLDGESRSLRAHWWRAGRYVLLRIQAGPENLEIKSLRVRRTGYPWALDSAFEDESGRFTSMLGICQSGWFNCSHETSVDCPYYEQLMYAGDSRIEALIGYAQTWDDRLARRAMELFDFSRSNHGFCSARFPSRNQMDILPFSMSWVWMLQDYLYWREDFPWLKQRLPGMRAVIAAFDGFLNSDGLLENLPGWNFADWADGWREGAAPCAEQVSCIINLMYLITLQKAAEVEAAIGDAGLAAWLHGRSHALAATIKGNFWNDVRGIFEEADPGKSNQHAQILAVVSGCYPEAMQTRMVSALLGDKSLTPTTLYFRHYLFEAFYQTGRVDQIIEGFGFWDQLRDDGLFTPLERTEPSRSDCHAWSSHPIFHLYASVLGIRPARPGFAEISIRPSSRDLGNLRAEMPHPRGTIRYRQQVLEDAIHIEIEGPAGVPIMLDWQGEMVTSSSGALQAQFARKDVHDR